MAQANDLAFSRQDLVRLNFRFYSLYIYFVCKGSLSFNAGKATEIPGRSKPSLASSNVRRAKGKHCDLENVSPLFLSLVNSLPSNGSHASASTVETGVGALGLELGLEDSGQFGQDEAKEEAPSRCVFTWNWWIWVYLYLYIRRLAVLNTDLVILPILDCIADFFHKSFALPRRYKLPR